MPPVIRRNPRRALAALAAALVGLATTLEAADFIFVWIQERMGFVLGCLCVAVWLTYMRTQDHDQNDLEVRARIGQLEEECQTFRRCFRFLLRKSGEDGAAEADAILGAEDPPKT